MQAMILAAGFGTRLLPHTEVRPKPLFPVLNKPLLLLTIERLKKIGVEHIIVNCHHLREQIIEALAGVDGVVLQEEGEILGTGGGLRKALPLLRDEPLLITNGDIYHDIDLKTLYEHHQEYGNTVTLAMHDCPRFNTVTVQGDRIKSFDRVALSTNLAFTGVHVIEPGLLEGNNNESFSCIIDRYRELLEMGELISSYRVDDCFWTDMGTVEDYLDLHAGLLQNKIPCWEELGQVTTAFHMHPRAEIGSGVALKDWVCVGDARVDHRSHLARVVLWDGVRVGSATCLEDTLVSTNV